MEVLVVRHGQSQADLENRHEGRADFPLTELGIKQAQLAAQWISEHFPPELILCSTLQRAAKTAEIIGESAGCQVLPEAQLMEWNNGLLAGLSREEADRRFPLPPGGKKAHDRFAETESMIDFRARAEMFWSRFRHEYIEPSNYKRIALVSHGGMINMLFRCFLELPMGVDISLNSGDTGIHLWEITTERRRVIFTNSREHLNFRK